MRNVLIATAALIAATAFGGEANAQSWCSPGAKLDVLWKGSWYPATAKATGPDGCLISYDGFGASWDERVGSDRAGPRDSKRAFAPSQAKLPTPETRPAPARPLTQGSGAKLGTYSCFVFVYGSGLRSRPGFILQPGGRYRHDFGGGGTFAIKGGVVEFTGGPLGGQAGKLDKGMIRLYNQDRSAMITDCEPS
jgi:hypothetical protein